MAQRVLVERKSDGKKQQGVVTGSGRIKIITGKGLKLAKPGEYKIVKTF